MRANMDGSDVSLLFSHLKKRDTSSGREKRQIPCTCENMELSSIFTMDHSRKEGVEMYVMDRLTSGIWAMDAEGCQCRLVVNATGRSDLGEIIIPTEIEQCLNIAYNGVPKLYKTMYSRTIIQRTINIFHMSTGRCHRRGSPALVLVQQRKRYDVQL